MHAILHGNRNIWVIISILVYCILLSQDVIKFLAVSKNFIPKSQLKPSSAALGILHGKQLWQFSTYRLVPLHGHAPLRYLTVLFRIRILQCNDCSIRAY